MEFLRQYKGLRKELYIVLFGRMMTNMGALIWPMMTMILKNKMGMSPGELSALLVVLGILQLPAILLGGKLADRFNKRNLIIVCDLVTVFSYLLCAVLPMGTPVVWLMFLASVFARMEWPSYDALVADLSTSKDRARAYSLSYLGGNVGLVLAPILGGFLFENHLNLAFLISSLATLSSTIMIFLFLKDVTPSKNEEGSYEEADQGRGVFSILKEKKILWLFLFCSGIGEMVYCQFNFLLPLNMEALYGGKGAVYVGVLTSINALVVILFTPVLTHFLRKAGDVEKIMMGECLIALGFAMYVVIQGRPVFYVVSMVIFTFGEILTTLGRQPYLTKRIPASHRGRLSSVSVIVTGAFQLGGQRGVGFLADSWPMQALWTVVSAVGLCNVGIYGGLRLWDKKVFGKLYGLQSDFPQKNNHAKDTC